MIKVITDTVVDSAARDGAVSFDVAYRVIAFI